MPVELEGLTEAGYRRTASCPTPRVLDVNESDNAPKERRDASINDTGIQGSALARPTIWDGAARDGMGDHRLPTYTRTKLGLGNRTLTLGITYLGGYCAVPCSLSVFASCLFPCRRPRYISTYY